MNLIKTSVACVALGIASAVASDTASKPVESAEIQSARAALASVELPAGPREAARWIVKAPETQRAAMVRAVAEAVFTKHPTAVYATARAILKVAPEQTEALVEAVLAAAPDQLNSVVLAVVESDDDTQKSTAVLLKAIQSRSPDRLAFAQKIVSKNQGAARSSGQLARASATPFVGVPTVVQTTTQPATPPNPRTPNFY